MSKFLINFKETTKKKKIFLYKIRKKMIKKKFFLHRLIKILIIEKLSYGIGRRNYFCRNNIKR